MVLRESCSSISSPEPPFLLFTWSTKRRALVAAITRCLVIALTSNFIWSRGHEALLFQGKGPLLLLFVYNFFSQPCEAFRIALWRQVCKLQQTKTLLTLGKFCCIGVLLIFHCKECNTCKGAHFYMIFRVHIFSSNPILFYCFFFFHKKGSYTINRSLNCQIKSINKLLLCNIYRINLHQYCNG